MTSLSHPQLKNQTSMVKLNTSDDNQEHVPTAPLPNPIGRNIDTITELHAQAERDVPGHQHFIESLTHSLARPRFLYSMLLVVSLWILPNVLPRRFKLPVFDPPPFNKLQSIATLSSLFITTGVLIRQSRQEKLAEQRAQLTMQLNLLSEQKIAKLISLIEELRLDLPDVQNRSDPEADVMQEPTDPRQVLETLEETLTEELKRLKQPKASDSR